MPRQRPASTPTIPVANYRVLFGGTARQRHVRSVSKWLPLNRCASGPLFVLMFAALSLLPMATADEKPPQRETDSASATGDSEWKPLTGSWVACEFGDDGKVEITPDLVTIYPGDPLTGVRWTGPVLRENYEVELEGRRVEGLDFFCGLTFPVGDDHVSFILGGWGGGVIGISSVDGYDASENSTSGYREFEQNKWYKVRVRVTDQAIECWIDDRRVVQQPREDHRFDVRFEMDVSLPLGIAAFECKSEIRNIRTRSLKSSGETTDRKPVGDDK